MKRGSGAELAGTVAGGRRSQEEAVWGRAAANVFERRLHPSVAPKISGAGGFGRTPTPDQLVILI
jgi:hypothetical protein